MSATRTLNNAEIQIAIKEFVEREGWTVSGTPEITHLAGSHDGSTYTASVALEPPARAKRPKSE